MESQASLADGDCSLKREGEKRAAIIHRYSVICLGNTQLPLLLSKYGLLTQQLQETSEERKCEDIVFLFSSTTNNTVFSFSMTIFPVLMSGVGDLQVTLLKCHYAHNSLCMLHCTYKHHEIFTIE